MASASIQNVNGSTAIVVNGKVLPPMFMTTECRNEAYLRRLGEAGMRLFFIAADTDWVRPGDPSFTPAKREWAYFIRPDMSKSGTEDFRTDLDTLFDAIPDAYVMVRLNVGPSVDWINAHPEEQVAYSDGKKHPVMCTSASRYEKVDGMHSLCSEAWRKEAEIAVHAFLKWLEATPYYDRVVGVFLCAAGTSEWYYPAPLVLPNGAVGDFSEPFKKHYSAFLRRKYGTEDALRNAWKMPGATFENPPIPTERERDFIYKSYERLTDEALHWIVKTKEEEIQTVASDTADGLFLNARDYAHVSDFYDAWNDGTAQTVLHFAEVVKAYRSDWLVGAFYGALGCTEYFDSSTSTGTLALLDSGLIDFLSAPGVYNDREPGGIVGLREMQDSFRLRNCVFINEDDSRTHRISPPAQKIGFGMYTIVDSLNTLKRDFGRNLCEDIQGWWFDMGGNWYDDPDILSLFCRQQEIAAAAYGEDRTKENGIALIYSLGSIHSVSMETDERVLDFYRTSDLGCIGAPVDYYFIEDMERSDMPDYKMYVMINAYRMTKEQRNAVRRKAAKNRALVLWLYAPGYLCPDGETSQNERNVSETTGIRVRDTGVLTYPHFAVDPTSHPALALASPSRRYGRIDKDVHHNVRLGQPCLKRELLKPAFYADDPDAAVLGRSCLTGQPFLAMKETDGYVSVFCTAQTVQNDLLRSLAAFAGVHVYAEGDDFVHANRHFVCIHAASDGEKTLSFPNPCSPFEVYEKRSYGENVTSLTVKMQKGQTLMWHLDGKI